MGLCRGTSPHLLLLPGGTFRSATKGSSRCCISTAEPHHCAWALVHCIQVCRMAGTGMADSSIGSCGRRYAGAGKSGRLSSERHLAHVGYWHASHEKPPHTECRNSSCRNTIGLYADRGRLCLHCKHCCIRARPWWFSVTAVQRMHFSSASRFSRRSCARSSASNAFSGHARPHSP